MDRVTEWAGGAQALLAGLWGRLDAWAASSDLPLEWLTAAALIALCVWAFLRAFWLEVRSAPSGCFFVDGGHLTDGDSLRLDGESYRLTGAGGPFNAPETRAGSQGRDGVPITEREAQWGVKATEHGRKLLGGRATLCPTGKRERYGRPLATIRLSNGRDYGAEMIRAGLATPTARREHDHWNRRRP